MKVRTLDQNGDWTFGAGIQNYASNQAALSQSILTRLKQWVGNCFFATAEGVDYANLLSIGTQTPLDLNIKRVILQTGGVLRVTGYSSTLNHVARSMAVSCNIYTIYGQLPFAETLTIGEVA